MNANRLIIYTIILITAVSSCNKKEYVKPLQTGLFGELPSYFPEPVYRFQTDNFFSEKGFLLGRKLFFDPQFSSDKTISCASCHIQQAAFSDPGKSISVGVQGGQGRRNSPAMFNLAWNPSFMWDGGINHIEIMPIAPIMDQHEMDMEISEVLELLNSSEEYKRRFYEVFKEDIINDQQLLYALTQYMTFLISSNSKYDHYRKGDVSFSSLEAQGLELFQQHCSSCHTEPLFTNYSFENNGVGATSNDNGRFEISLNEEDKGKFRVPSLRNIALTYPYMHNGSISTLESVIDHYSFQENSSPFRANELQDGFQFTEAEKQALIVFLHTLTDEEFISNPIFQEP